MSGDSAENALAASFKCPLTRCNENISPSLLLSHFMGIHQKDEEKVDFEDVEDSEKISLLVSVAPDYLELDKNVCLSILAYQMEKKHSNVLLLPAHQAFKSHHPILIMACRSNYVKIFDDEAYFIDPDADFLALWLLIPFVDSKRKLMATLTVHNKDLTKSLSSLVHIRSASASQDVSEFMHRETDFLLVNSGFLGDIATVESIYVEVSITENLMRY
jgi:Domain of unknown function (DUF4729)